MEKNRRKSADLKGISDNTVPVDQVAVSARLSGKQPTIDIAGHTFFVDLPWGLLRPKDDFSTLGISFDAIDRWFNDIIRMYQFPYNPSTHQAAAIDLEAIIRIPGDIVFVEIPSQKELDPVGYARKHDQELNDTQKEFPVRAHFQARTIPWEETSIPEFIKRNLHKQQKNIQQAIQDKQVLKRRTKRRM